MQTHRQINVNLSFRNILIKKQILVYMGSENLLQVRRSLHKLTGTLIDGEYKYTVTHITPDKISPGRKYYKQTFLLVLLQVKL